MQSTTLCCRMRSFDRDFQMSRLASPTPPALCSQLSCARPCHGHLISARPMPSWMPSCASLPALLYPRLSSPAGVRLAADAAGGDGGARRSGRAQAVRALLLPAALVAALAMAPSASLLTSTCRAAAPLRRIWLVLKPQLIILSAWIKETRPLSRSWCASVS